MGVPQFLSEILQSAGRPVDLQVYSNGILESTLHHTMEEADSNDGAFRTSSSCLLSSSSVPLETRRRRPLRIGVDVSTWIYRAAQGYSEMLGDEKHLSNYGRATLLLTQEQERQQYQEEKEEEAKRHTDEERHQRNNSEYDLDPVRGEHRQKIQEYITSCALFVINQIKKLHSLTQSELLIVLDGATPPIKRNTVRQRAKKRKEAEKERDRPVQDMDVSTNDNNKEQEERRIKAFRRAGAGKHYNDIISEMILGLRENLIPFLVAPYEADGQLAWLIQRGYIDLIITEDSDLAGPYGASPILYKVAESLGKGNNTTNSSNEVKGILIRRQDLASNPNKLNLLDFSPAMLAVVFVATGSDYCRKLKGIGLITAVDIVRSSFLFESNQDNGKISTNREDDNDYPPPPLKNVFVRLYRQTWETNLTNQDKDEYESYFLAALLMYRHSIVFDPIHGCCCTLGNQQGDPELMSYQPYADLFHDHTRRENIVGKYLPPLQASMIAEGWISSKTFQPRTNMKLPDYVVQYLATTTRQEEDIIHMHNPQHGTEENEGNNDDHDHNTNDMMVTQPKQQLNLF